MTASPTLFTEFTFFHYGIQWPKRKDCQIQCRIFYNAMLMPHHCQFFFECANLEVVVRLRYDIIEVKVSFIPRRMWYLVGAHIFSYGFIAVKSSKQPCWGQICYSEVSHFENHEKWVFFTNAFYTITFENGKLKEKAKEQQSMET
jgi:hypothetical protein